LRRIVDRISTRRATAGSDDQQEKRGTYLEIHEGTIHLPKNKKALALAKAFSTDPSSYLLARSGRGSCRRGGIVIIARDSCDNEYGCGNRCDRGRAEPTNGSSTSAACSTCATRAGLCLRNLGLAGWFCGRGSLLLRKGDGRSKQNSNKSSNKAFHSNLPGGQFSIEPG